jgi:hypothetical protein
MPCALTQGNNLSCNDGFGGMPYVYLGNREKFKFTIVNGQVTQIVKEVGARFFKYELPPFTGDFGFNKTTSQGDGTSECKHSINIVVNKLSGSVRNELEIMSKANVVAIAKDNNGVFHLLGHEFGLTTGIDGKSGKALKDRNGAEIKLEGMEKEIPYTVLDTLESSFEVPGV